MKPPCKNCDCRSVICHCNCDKYKEYSAYMEKRRESNHAKSEKIKMFDDHFHKTRKNFGFKD